MGSLITNFFKKTIRDVPIERKTVLVRADYNVPLTTSGDIADDFRIRSSVPTLRYLIEQQCKVVVISHLGRPDGRDPALSLEQVGIRLTALLGQPVGFVDDTIGDKVKTAIRKAPAASVTLLENLRYYKQEEANDETFARAIADATGARYFVQDGFGVVHRAHASTDAITHYIPSVAGLLVSKEYQTIEQAMQRPARPLVAVLGGAKVSDKIGVIERLVQTADTIVIGGAMANTFLAHQGFGLGKSKVESDQAEIITRIYDAAATKATDPAEFLILPQDVAVAPAIIESAERRSVPLDQIKSDDIALDIGDRTIERYSDVVSRAKTVIWNGTLGYAEIPAFAHGSARIALALATNPDVTSIIGGGDTADFVLGWDGTGGSSFTHVSTGGGASLELMSGLKLPGVESLLDGDK